MSVLSFLIGKLRGLLVTAVVWNAQPIVNAFLSHTFVIQPAEFKERVKVVEEMLQRGQMSNMTI